MKRLNLFLLLGCILFLCTPAAQAIPLGENITIYDGQGILKEDGEVEPNSIWGQNWDMEGFFLKNQVLTMVGGYNFVTGEYGNGRLFRSGDLFIDVAGFGLGGPNGYDYVLDLDFISKSYYLYALTANSTVRNVYYSVNRLANPWRYASGGLQLGDRFDFLGYYSNLANSEVDGLLGGNHYAAAFDLSFLSLLHPNSEFTVHFTMECGNDNLMGKGTATAPVPEPATMVLFGTGLMGIAGMIRKRNRK